MTTHASVMLGGLFCVAFAVFHLFFWRLFDWKRDLASLSFINRQVMQLLNLSLTFTFLVFAYISLLHTRELLETDLGHVLLLLIALLWFLRAIEQIIFFSLKRPLSVAFFVTFLLGTALYTYPWLATRAS
jgi:hypothetical protein